MPWWVGVRLGGSFVDSLVDMVWVARVGVEVALVMGFVEKGVAKGVFGCAKSPTSCVPFFGVYVDG